jgi:hypothetical protein
MVHPVYLLYSLDVHYLGQEAGKTTSKAHELLGHLCSYSTIDAFI